MRSEDGSIYLRGRKSDIIMLGGKNVYSITIK